jgi:hypothetical protein
MQTQPSDESSIRPPRCTDCKRPMSFVTSAPDEGRESFQHMMFACDCGLTSELIITQFTP